MAGNVGNKFIIIAFLLIIALVSYISLPILIPFIFGGSAAPLFVIHNHDDKSHEVTVEVFDQNNNSIINETHTLERRSDFTRSRPLIVRLPWEDIEYTFKVTMDKQITNVTKVEIPDRKTSVNIRLYYEIIPITITTVKWM